MQNKLFFAFLFGSCKNENNQNGKEKQNQPAISESKVDLKDIDQKVIKEYIENLPEEEFEKVTGKRRFNIESTYKEIEKMKDIRLSSLKDKSTLNMGIPIKKFLYQEFLKNFENLKIKHSGKEISINEFLNSNFEKIKYYYSEYFENTNTFALLIYNNSANGYSDVETKKFFEYSTKCKEEIENYIGVSALFDDKKINEEYFHMFFDDKNKLLISSNEIKNLNLEGFEFYRGFILEIGKDNIYCKKFIEFYKNKTLEVKTYNPKTYRLISEDIRVK